MISFWPLAVLALALVFSALPLSPLPWRGAALSYAQTVTNDDVAESGDDDDGSDDDDDSSNSGSGSDDATEDRSGSNSGSDDDDDGPNTNSGSRSKDSSEDDDDDDEGDDDDEDEGEDEDEDEDEDEAEHEEDDEGDDFDPFDRAFREGRDHDSYVADEVLVANAPVGFLQQVQSLGFRILEVRRLSSLGIDVVRLSTPRGTSALSARRDLATRFPDLLFDVNGLYGLQQATVIGTAGALRSLIEWSEPCNIDLTIGMIDTGVDDSALSGTGTLITQWTASGAPTVPGDHGTGVAGILIGSPAAGLDGMVAGADLAVAAVFDSATDRPAAIVDIVSGLDWLVAKGSRVVNLSIAGEPSPLLQVALARTLERGLVAVAAVGNSGPDAVPLWPAADPAVIAVTAVDAKGALYPDAIHGNHVDLAAPGVAVPTVGVDGQNARRSGTSFAAPFVTAAAAVLLDAGTAPAAVAGELAASARDLGPNGFDASFGAGLITRPTSCREAS